MRVKWKWAAAALLGGIACTVAWRSSNVAVALDSVTRLRTVWPDIATLSRTDRALVSMLAAQCELQTQPDTADATIACLRDAAKRPQFVLPSGIHDAAIELEQLLTHRPPAALH